MHTKSEMDKSHGANIESHFFPSNLKLSIAIKSTGP